MGIVLQLVNYFVLYVIYYMSITRSIKSITYMITYNFDLKRKLKLLVHLE